MSDKSRSQWKLQIVQGDGLGQFRGRRAQRAHTLRETSTHTHTQRHREKKKTKKRENRRR